MKNEESQHPHELISAFSDQMATPEEASRLQEHLRDCAECRQLLHDLSRLATAVGEEAVPAPPIHLAEKIRMRIDSAKAPRPVPRTATFWRSPFPLAAAATLLMGTTLWLAWRRETSSQDLPISSALEAPAPAPKGAGDHASEAPPTPSSAPPAIAKNEKQKTESQEQALRSLGYLGDAAGSPAPPEEDARKPSDESALGPASTPPSRVALGAVPRAEPDQAATSDSNSKRKDYLDLITSSGLTGEDYKKATERKAPAAATQSKDDGPSASGYEGDISPQAMKEAAPSAAPGEIRSLAYEGPRFSATFSEDGLVTLIARGYACSVTVPMPSPGATSGGRSRAIEDLPGLFTVAASPDFLAAGPSPENSQELPAAPASGATSSLALRNGEGDPIHSISFTEPLSQESPQVLRTLRQGIQSLIQQRYRKDLETRCGPLPGALLSNP